MSRQPHQTIRPTVAAMSLAAGAVLAGAPAATAAPAATTGWVYAIRDTDVLEIVAISPGGAQTSVGAAQAGETIQDVSSNGKVVLLRSARKTNSQGSSYYAFRLFTPATGKSTTFTRKAMVTYGTLNSDGTRVLTADYDESPSYTANAYKADGTKLGSVVSRGLGAPLFSDSGAWIYYSDYGKVKRASANTGAVNKTYKLSTTYSSCTPANWWDAARTKMVLSCDRRNSDLTRDGRIYIKGVSNDSLEARTPTAPRFPEGGFSGAFYTPSAALFQRLYFCKPSLYTKTSSGYTGFAWKKGTEHAPLGTANGAVYALTRGNECGATQSLISQKGSTAQTLAGPTAGGGRIISAVLVTPQGRPADPPLQ